MLDSSGRLVYYIDMPRSAHSAQLEPPAQDEALLESLLARLSPSVVSVLNAALRFASTHPSKSLPPELMLSALQVRGEQNAPVWLGKLGQMLGVQEITSLTGLSKSGVHKAKDEDRLFAVRLSGEHFDRFPLFQFRAGQVRQWMGPLLELTGNGLPAAHFLAISRKRLKNQSYIDLLREVDDPDVIKAMLRHAGSIGDEARAVDDSGGADVA